jgi:UTP-glucose-1-phosphate uridylyltransferase
MGAASLAVRKAVFPVAGLGTRFLPATKALEFEGKRYDTGDKLGFLKATVEFTLARPDLCDAFRAFLRGVDL